MSKLCVDDYVLTMTCEFLILGCLKCHNYTSDEVIKGDYMVNMGMFAYNTKKIKSRNEM